jgi:tetrapyrrole methylase family protein/MazG family protein
MPNTKNKTTRNNQNLHLLIKTIEALLSDDGCPWDKRQTSQSLLKYLSSEYQELVDAINNDDPDNTCEELGDLLYIIIMYCKINDSLGNFSLSDVIAGIDEKLIRRHPHVFAGKTYENEAQLAKQWEEIKTLEKKKNSV